MPEDYILSKLELIFFIAGLPVCGKGFPYLSRAVCLALDEPRRLQEVWAHIYSPVAKEFHTSPQAVEKALQRVRDNIYETPCALSYFRSTGSAAWGQQRIYPRELIGQICLLLKRMYYKDKNPI